MSAAVAWVSEGTLCEPCTLDELAALLDVTVATVRRWGRARHVPALAAARLRTVVLGLFEHKRWSGWSVDRDGRLWSSSGRGFMPAEVEHVGFQRQHIQVLRERIDELELEVKRLTSRLNAGDVFAGVRPFRHRRPSRAIAR